MDKPLKTIPTKKPHTEDNATNASTGKQENSRADTSTPCTTFFSRRISWKDNYRRLPPYDYQMKKTALSILYKLSCCDRNHASSKYQNQKSHENIK